MFVVEHTPHAMISVKAVALACWLVVAAAKADPCVVIGGQKWVAPSDVRACFTSFKVDPAVKSNVRPFLVVIGLVWIVTRADPLMFNGAKIIEVVNKTLALHTSVNYQIRAPEPFTQYVHEDLLVDLARISQQPYFNDLDLHIDLSRTLKRLNDGHCVYINSCYDCTHAHSRVLSVLSYAHASSSLLDVPSDSSRALDGFKRTAGCSHCARGFRRRDCRVWI